jgi:hypothetical protein
MTPQSSPSHAWPSLLRLYALFAVSAAGLVAAGWALSGLDMAAAILLGSAIVGLNLAGTVRLVKVVLRERRFKALLAGSMIAKFGLTLAVLYVALGQFGVDAVGILIGLSTMLLTSLLYMLVPRGGR